MRFVARGGGSPSSDAAALTRRMGVSVFRTHRSAKLPSQSRDTPPRPWLAITISPAFHSLASRAISAITWPSRTFYGHGSAVAGPPRRLREVLLCLHPVGGAELRVHEDRRHLHDMEQPHLPAVPPGECAGGGERGFREGGSVERHQDVVEHERRWLSFPMLLRSFGMRGSAARYGEMCQLFQSRVVSMALCGRMETLAERTRGSESSAGHGDLRRAPVKAGKAWVWDARARVGGGASGRER